MMKHFPYSNRVFNVNLIIAISCSTTLLPQTSHPLIWVSHKYRYEISLSFLMDNFLYVINELKQCTLHCINSPLQFAIPNGSLQQLQAFYRKEHNLCSQKYSKAAVHL